jgi:hypothetical protein
MKIGIMKFLGVDIDLLIQDFQAECSHKDMVRVARPDEKNQYDLLVLPDFVGYDMSGKGFLPHMILPPMYEGPNQDATFFQKNMLDFWLRKKDVLIFGVGNSACMVWEAQGGKLDFVDGKVVPLSTKGFNGMVEYRGNGFVASSVDFEGVEIFRRSTAEEMYHMVAQRMNGKNPSAFNNDEGDFEFELVS